MEVSNALFLELTLEIDSIIVGERVKGGVFRPCQETIPSSTIEGALRHNFNIDVMAVGFFERNTYEVKHFTYSLSDKMLNTAVVPIFTNYLAPLETGRSSEKINAKVYIPYSEGEGYRERLYNAEFYMGAMKSKGFGKCKITNIKKVEYEIVQGFLNVKVFLEEAIGFGISVISPLYGFLFKPDRYYVGGVYKKALFPGSLVEAPEIFLKAQEDGERVSFYDR